MPIFQHPAHIVVVLASHVSILLVPIFILGLGVRNLLKAETFAANATPTMWQATQLKNGVDLGAGSGGTFILGLGVRNLLKAVIAQRRKGCVNKYNRAEVLVVRTVDVKFSNLLTEGKMQTVIEPKDALKLRYDFTLVADASPSPIRLRARPKLSSTLRTSLSSSSLPFS